MGRAQDTKLHDITWHHMTSHFMTLNDIKRHHMTSYEITWHPIDHMARHMDHNQEPISVAEKCWKYLSFQTSTLPRPYEPPEPVWISHVMCESAECSSGQWLPTRKLHGNKKSSPFPPRTQWLVSITAATAVMLLKLSPIPRLPLF